MIFFLQLCSHTMLFLKTLVGREEIFLIMIDLVVIN